MSSGADGSEPGPAGAGAPCPPDLHHPKREPLLPSHTRCSTESRGVGGGSPPMSSGTDGSEPGPAGVGAPCPDVHQPKSELLPLHTRCSTESRVVGEGSAPMSSDADGLELRPGPGPATELEKEVGRDPPVQQAPQQEVAAAEAPAPAITIVISQPVEVVRMTEPKGVAPPPPNPEEGRTREDSVLVTAAAAAKEAELARTDSFDDYEQCRVCQQKTEEPLVDLGCQCRGDLAKAHRTCIGVWFRTRGSNKCEICQQVAVNIPPPETQTTTSYWVWRVDSTYGRGRGGHERGWFSPLWVAFAILIGGLLLDVLISVSLGVSALPVNIIIGVLIVLGLGTALRLALECCQEWGSRRSTTSNMPRLENIPPTGYHPAVV